MDQLDPAYRLQTNCFDLLGLCDLKCASEIIDAAQSSSNSASLDSVQKEIIRPAVNPS